MPLDPACPLPDKLLKGELAWTDKLLDDELICIPHEEDHHLEVAVALPGVELKLVD